MSRKSFSNRLSWRIIGIVSAIFIIGLVVVGVVSHLIIADESVMAAKHILHGTISDIEKPLTEVEISTQAVASYMATVKDNPDALQNIARQTVVMGKLISGCAVIFLDPHGNLDTTRPPVFCYLDADGPHDFHPNEDQLQKIISTWGEKPFKTKTPCWTVPYHSFYGDGNLSATYCYPMADASLNVYAILATNFPVDWIEQKVEGIRPYPTSLTTIACSDSVIIGLGDTQLVKRYKNSLNGDERYTALVEDMRMNKDSVRRRMGKGRDLSFVVYGPLHNGWMLSIFSPYRDVLRRSSQMHVFLIVLGLLGLTVLFFTCRRVIRRLTRPITELSVSALNMAKGNFKAQLPEIKTQDEMMRLHDSFVYMQNSIADYIEQLKTTTNDNERMESELSVARNIQMGMLRTDFPYQLHAMLIPAKEVGGDLYDFALMGNELYFAIGDVSGKGVPASLMMAITRATLRFVAGLGLPLNETLSRINDSVTDSNSHNMFVTLFVGRLNLRTGHLDYCNAGHNPVVIIPESGEPYFLKVKSNLAIGLFEDFAYESESIDLKPGTRIIAYTDGVSEAERADESQFGNTRLLEWAKNLQQTGLSLDSKAQEHASQPEKDVVNNLYDTVREFVGDTPQNDDITIMSVRI